MRGFKTIEKKYGIKVTHDYYDWLMGDKQIEKFRVYTADGCLWNKGLTRAGVKVMVEHDAPSLKAIKKQCREAKRKAVDELWKALET